MHADESPSCVLMQWCSVLVLETQNQCWRTNPMTGDRECGPTNSSVITTPLPIKLLSLVSSSCVTWIKTKREGVKSGCSSALKPDRLGLSCTVNKCSDVGIGDLSMLPTHKISP